MYGFCFGLHRHGSSDLEILHLERWMQPRTVPTAGRRTRLVLCVSLVVTIQFIHL
jgi:hypothetical protein